MVHAEIDINPVNFHEYPITKQFPNVFLFCLGKRQQWFFCNVSAMGCQVHETVSPAETTTYIIEAEGPEGTETARKTVDVVRLQITIDFPPGQVTIHKTIYKRHRNIDQT